MARLSRGGHRASSPSPVLMQVLSPYCHPCDYSPCHPTLRIELTCGLHTMIARLAHVHDQWAGTC